MAQLALKLEPLLLDASYIVELPAKRKAFIVGGGANTMIRFRGALIKELVAQGYEVVCASSPTDAESERKLAALGARYIPIPLSRGSINPLHDIATLWKLFNVLKQERPDVVLSYNMKPIVYGTLAAWLARVNRRVAMVEGLGYAYTPGKEWKRRVARVASDILYRVPCALSDAVIVLNKDDRAFFANGFMRGKADRVHLVPGIGVDLNEFKPEPLPEGRLTFIMISRLLRDKGVYEFAEAARLAKQQGLDARFVLAGGLDSNPTAIKKPEVEAWVKDGRLEYVGEVADVRPWIKQSHVVVLPSYREGMPRVVMEAMAMGRPCIVSDVPGCREAIEQGLTGHVVTPQSPAALASTMAMLVGNRDIVRGWSNAAARVAQTKFDAAAAGRILCRLLQNPQTASQAVA